MGLGSPQEIWGGGVWGHPMKNGMRILGSPGGIWGASYGGAEQGGEIWGLGDILRETIMGWRDLG